MPLRLCRSVYEPHACDHRSMRWDDYPHRLLKPGFPRILSFEAQRIIDKYHGREKMGLCQSFAEYGLVLSPSNDKGHPERKDANCFRVPSKILITAREVFEPKPLRTK
jgi:hypothetical protein